MDFQTVLAFLDFSKIDLIEVAHFLLALYLSLSVHEAAHAWMASRCGDDTARLMGRMTLNPIAHIDPIGTVVMPLLMVVTSGIPLIGWAKPVPVNPVRFRNMRRGEILVSLAGPASNLVLVVGALVVCLIVIRTLGIIHPDIFALRDANVLEMGDFTMAQKVGQGLYRFFFGLMMLNLMLFLFNLIPIPPLDGSHILGVFLSREAAVKYERALVPPFNYVVILLVALPVLSFLFGLIYGRVMLRLMFVLWT